LGAGYSGVLAAKKLAKRLKNKKVDIAIIDKNPFHTMLTELHEVAAWRVDESSVRIELAKIFEGRRVDVIMDNITKIDYENNTLISEESGYDFDYLVLASGRRPEFYDTTGAVENAFPLWSYDDAVRLREHIMNMFRMASRERDPDIKRACLTFYIIGCGFTGTSMTSELAELVPSLCEKFSIDPSLVNIHNLDIVDRMIPALPEKASEKARKRLEKMGVDIAFGTHVVKVTPESIEFAQAKQERIEQGDGRVEIKTVAGDEKITDKTRTVIWCAGTAGSEIVNSSEELGHCNNGQRIATDKFLRSKNHPNVYIAGDNLYYKAENAAEPVHQGLRNCRVSAGIIADNIVADIKDPANDSAKTEYNPKPHGAIVAIGGRYGVAAVGKEKNIILPSFIAMFGKHWINFMFCWKILGFAKALDYNVHEFFTIRKRRSFVGGNLSNRAPLFLIFPLRVYMGILFLWSAMGRIADGWLRNPVIDSIFANISQNVRERGIDINLWNQFRLSTFTEQGQSFLWFQTTPISWFIETFVISSQSNEMFFQGFIVVLEIILGVALIIGLFTTLSSLTAAKFMVMIAMTVGLPMGQWWMIFAGIAFMFTASKIFSVDYYLMPAIKKCWKKFKFVKKWYLYNE